MNSLQLFKNSIIAPTKLIEARKNPFWKVVLYILFLNLLTLLPVLAQAYQVTATLKQDSEEIVKKLPDFEIKDGTLQTDSKDSGFIYQSTNFIFTFDPDGKRSEASIRSDAVGNVMGIAFMPNKLLLVLPDNPVFSQFSSIIPSEITYDKKGLAGLTKETLTEDLEETKLPMGSVITAFIIGFYSLLVTLLLNILITTIGANIYAKFRFQNLRFSENFKIVTYLSTLPTIFVSILSWFRPMMNTSGIFLLLTLLLYYYMLRQVKPPTTDGQSLE